VAAEGREERRRRLGVEPSEADVLEFGLAAQRPERFAQGVALLELRFPVRADDEQSVTGGRAGDMAQHGHAAPVSPVEVVENEQDGCAAGAGHQELGGGVDQAEPLLVGLHGSRLRDAGENVADPGQQLRQRRCRWPEVFEQRLGIRFVDLLGESLGEQRVRRRPVALEGPARQHGHALAAGPLGDLLHHPALAHARLPGDEHQATVTGGSFCHPGHQAGQFGVPADHGDLGGETLCLGVGGLVADLTGGHRVGYALEENLAELGEREAGPPGQQPCHRFGAEDLAAVGPVA
jgi:hypothetical protein